jgi:hypothetical protein
MVYVNPNSRSDGFIDSMCYSGNIIDVSKAGEFSSQEHKFFDPAKVNESSAANVWNESVDDLLTILQNNRIINIFNRECSGVLTKWKLSSVFEEFGSFCGAYDKQLDSCDLVVNLRKNCFFDFAGNGVSASDYRFDFCSYLNGLAFSIPVVNNEKISFWEFVFSDFFFNRRFTPVSCSSTINVGHFPGAFNFETFSSDEGNFSSFNLILDGKGYVGKRHAPGQDTYARDFSPDVFRSQGFVHPFNGYGPIIYDSGFSWVFPSFRDLEVLCDDGIKKAFECDRIESWLRDLVRYLSVDVGINLFYSLTG